MRSINEEEVLRLNCPGFGHQSYLTAGCARPLYDYRAIIVNPVSILHLFDKDPDLLTQVHNNAQEGLTSYGAKSDKVLESITPDLENRIRELGTFFEKGGLLVYYLCPPFEIQGPNVSLDNYTWLDDLAPDKPTGRNDRHMSAAARGAVKEATAECKASEFATYFKEKVEWCTLIRSENLTDGYSMLATAGPNKCVAGQFATGNNGRIVFLPAPYSRDYDRKLMECINIWYAKTPEAPPTTSAPKQTHASAPPPQAKPAAPKAEAHPEKPAAPKAEAPPEKPAAPKAEAPPEKPAAPKAEAPPEKPAAPKAEAPPERPAAPKAEAPQAKTAPPPAATAKPKAEPAAKAAPQPAAEAHHKEQVKPPAKDLMNKMEKISKAAVPEWCKQYSFPDLDRLQGELADLKEAIRQTEEKIHKVEGRIQRMEGLKNSLLSAEGHHLLEACHSVFKQMGWSVKVEDAGKGEMWLSQHDSVQAIVRVVRSTSQVKRADLAHLAEAVITYWGQHETEPKGILVASTWANRPPSERTEDDYVESLAEFAEKKNICLLTTCQLLCIYRDLESHNQPADELRKNILSTSGRLPGFALEGKRVEQPVY